MPGGKVNSFDSMCNDVSVPGITLIHRSCYIVEICFVEDALAEIEDNSVQVIKRIFKFEQVSEAA